MNIIPWYYRALAVLALIGAVYATGWIKGVQHCEQQADDNELKHRRDNDKTLAENREHQAKLQSDLDRALDLLRRTQHACLSTPHPAAVECVLNLRSQACP